MTSTILITGATGHVGRATLAALPANAHVRAGVRNTNRVNLPDSVTPVVFDFTQSHTFAAALDGIDQVMLIRPPQLANVKRDIAPFVQATADAGVKHMTFLSVQGVEDAGFIPHAKIEALIQATPMNWTFLRPGFFNQNFSSTHAVDLRDGDTVFIPTRKGRLSYVDVRDIGVVAAQILTEPDAHAAKAYTLTGREALDGDQVAAIFSEVLQRPITYARPHPIHFAWHMWRTGTPLGFALFVTLIYMPTYFNQTGDLTDTLAELLGREPITFRQFVEDYRDTWNRDES